MRASKAIGLYAIAVIVLGAIFAPWLFWTVQWMAAHLPAVQGLARHPFRRVFTRSVMIVALVGLWPLLRGIGIRSWRELGYVRSQHWWQHALIGFALGVGSLVIAIGIAVALGIRPLTLDKTSGELAGAILQYILTGIVVAVIEETFFRGALQGAFQRGMNVVVAVALASAIYSALHFLKPKGVNIVAAEVTWSSGFTCLAGILARSFGERDVLVGFVTLFLAGCILGLAYAKTRALYLSIGLHAGWVLANESARWLGAGRIVEDVIAWPVLALLLVFVWWLCTTKLKPLAIPGSPLWARRALDVIYPRNCPFCHDPLLDIEPGVVCRACVSSAKIIEPPFCRQCASPFAGTVTGETFVCGYCQDLRFYFSRTVCACRAEGVARDCILRFKYNREMYFGPHLVDWLVGAAQRWIDWREVDAIVPVPLHPRKQRHREFNQAEYFATGLSRALNVPVLKRNARRVKDTGTQTKLDAETRARNLHDAFALRNPKAVAGKRFVLLDDVFTTGATLNSCAKVLRRAGAKEVIALAVARGM